MQTFAGAINNAVFAKSVTYIEFIAHKKGCHIFAFDIENDDLRHSGTRCRNSVCSSGSSFEER